MFQKKIRALTLINRYYNQSSIPLNALVARYTKTGRPQEVLKLTSENISSPTGNQVTVKMIFAPINPADLNMIQGQYPTQPELPAVGGNEGLGEVCAVGPSVKNLKVGSLVFPTKQGFGTWRTFAVCPESDLICVDSFSADIPKEYLATLTVNPATAYRLLTDFVQLKPGDVVIQNGANSMVGTSVIQLAAMRGIKTINIIRPRSDYPELVEKLKSYGAYVVITDEFMQKRSEFQAIIKDLPKPKLALNCVGGDTSTEMIRLLERGGSMVTYGGMSLKPVTVPTSSFIFNDISLKGFWMSRWYAEHSTQEKLALLSELASYVKNQKLRIWTERHSFKDGFDTALDRAINTNTRDRKVLLKFE